MDNKKFDVVSSTKKCQSDNACINLIKYTLSNIKDKIKNEVLFVDSIRSNCRYNLTFGYKEVYTCPIRKEIFLKYNV